MDFWFVAGISVVVRGTILALPGGLTLRRLNTQVALAVQVLLNYPHFAGSFWLLYRSRRQVQRYRRAAVTVPVLLFVYMVVAVALTGLDLPVPLVLLSLVASVYLSWHYTGQNFGMVSTWAVVDGVRFSPDERSLIRLSFRFLLAWQVVWHLRVFDRMPTPWRPAIDDVYQLAPVLLLVAAGLGAMGYLRWQRRTGRRVPVRVVLPWIINFLWYACMAKDSRFLLVAQLSHCLQYLLFPTRVFRNDQIRRTGSTTPRFAAHGWVQVALFFGGLMALGVLLFELVPYASSWAVYTATGSDVLQSNLRTGILAYLNIHHFFADSIIWRIQNPEVRRELFSHWEQPAPTAQA